jgi:tRNA modification GTPase
MTSPIDTIVATATPPGTGGIAVVRVSGAATERIARTMLGSLPEPRTAALRRFCGTGQQVLDSGLALYFPAPASFTGESVLELHGHGGPTVVSLLVDEIVALGARRAAPGEFSQRAFLNGKLDLAQAEAIADLINAGTEQAARAALRSLAGDFSRTVHALAERLLRLRMHVEAAIDFPEDEVDFLADDALLQSLRDCATAFEALQQTTAQGRVLRDGYQVVIVGKPNAGKSSLLNALSGEDAAIVTEIAGTTRDILRERINIEGLAVDLVDTAGLREDPGRIEAEGMRRARAAMRGADAVLWVQDAADADTEIVNEELPDGVPVVVVRNKTDLTNEQPGCASPSSINISAKTGAGLDALRQRLREMAGYENQGEGAVTARQRHLDALVLAATHFNAGRAALMDTQAGELLAEELRLSHRALAQITGAVSSDDLLGLIFSEFCIGK